ncbi:MAG TPA: hypothetical protein VF939_01995 [Puia sp.]
MPSSPDPTSIHELQTLSNPVCTFMPINPRKEPLTPDKLRELSGNHSLSDQEAAGIIQTINKLTSIFLELTRLKNIYCIDNQQDVSLIPEPPDDPAIELNPTTKNKAA